MVLMMTMIMAMMMLTMMMLVIAVVKFSMLCRKVYYKSLKGIKDSHDYDDDDVDGSYDYDGDDSACGNDNGVMMMATR
jgi:hypothetical protein